MAMSEGNAPAERVRHFAISLEELMFADDRQATVGNGETNG
jgi:hypothetical protein